MCAAYKAKFLTLSSILFDHGYAITKLINVKGFVETDVQVIQQFATWLCTHARKTVGTELQYLMLGSVKDILSSTRKIFNFVFPSNSIFTGAKEQTWYSTLRYSSQQEIVRRDMRLEAFF